MSIDKFIVDGQEPKIAEKIHSKISDMLSHDERINYIALQKKPAVTLLPDSITITNRRIFLCEFTKLGLSTNFEIFSWKDIKDIVFKEEIFGSKVTVIPFTGENLSIDYIPKTQARKLYQLIKEALENVNNIEEVKTPMPAASPVVESRTEITIPTINDLYKQQAAEQIKEDADDDFTTIEIEKPQEVAPVHLIPSIPTTPQYTTATSIPSAPIIEQEDEMTIKLKKLKSLYDKQLITQAEYESKKSEILSQL